MNIAVYNNRNNRVEDIDVIGVNSFTYIPYDDDQSRLVAIIKNNIENNALDLCATYPDNFEYIVINGDLGLLLINGVKSTDRYSVHSYAYMLENHLNDILVFDYDVHNNLASVSSIYDLDKQTMELLTFRNEIGRVEYGHRVIQLRLSQIFSCKPNGNLCIRRIMQVSKECHSALRKAILELLYSHNYTTEKIESVLEEHLSEKDYMIIVELPKYIMN